MNIQQINIGQYPNDGSGDDLRTAFEKIIGNFSEIDLKVVLSAENIGAGAPIALTNPINNALRFRTIVSDNSNMSVSYDSDEITLSVSDLSLQDLTNVSSNTPNLNDSLVWNGTKWTPTAPTTPTAGVTRIIAGNNITISPSSGQGEVTVNSTGASNVPTDFNFGTLGNITNVFELILQSTSVDFGSMNQPSSLMLDLGSIGEPLGIVNGGSPGTITFTSAADGGNISTSVFADIFDGGTVI